MMTLANPLHDMELVVVSSHHMNALADGGDSLQSLLGVRVPAQWPQFKRALLPPERGGFGARRRSDWPGFFFICPRRKALLGNGGFKGPPDRGGVVEIGYEIAAEHQGHGFATTAVVLMLSYAFDLHDASAVRAHTLAGPNASNRVLQKAGMEFTGTRHDENAGPIWSWCITAEKYHRLRPDRTAS